MPLILIPKYGQSNLSLTGSHLGFCKHTKCVTWEGGGEGNSQDMRWLHIISSTIILYNIIEVLSLDILQNNTCALYIYIEVCNQSKLINCKDYDRVLKVVKVHFDITLNCRWGVVWLEKLFIRWRRRRNSWHSRWPLSGVHTFDGITLV